MATAVGNDTSLIGAVAITHGVREIGSTGSPVMPEIVERFSFDIRGLPHGVLAKLFLSERARLVEVAFGSRFIGTTRGGVRADLYVAADRRESTIVAVQGSLWETCVSGTLKVLKVHRRGRVRKLA